MKKFNLKYVVMSCIMLHNLCMELHDPYEPRWKVEEMELARHEVQSLAKQKRIERNCPHNL